MWRGTGGQEAGRIGGGRGTGDGAGSRIPKEAGGGEKLRKILQHCITFYYRNRTGAGTCMEEGGKPEFKVQEAGVSRLSCPPPLENWEPLPFWCPNTLLISSVTFLHSCGGL